MVYFNITKNKFQPSKTTSLIWIYIPVMRGKIIFEVASPQSTVNKQPSLPGFIGYAKINSKGVLRGTKSL